MSSEINFQFDLDRLLLMDQKQNENKLVVSFSFPYVKSSYSYNLSFSNAFWPSSSKTNEKQHHDDARVFICSVNWIVIFKIENEPCSSLLSSYEASNFNISHFKGERIFRYVSK